MTDVSLHQHGRFNDALERDLMQRALGNGEAISVSALLKSIWTGVKKASSATAEYVIALTDALNEARARDAKMSGSQW